MNNHSRVGVSSLDRLVPLFLTFRLTYIPAAVLSHSEHGFVWLNMALGIAMSLGGEWLGRRSRTRLASSSALVAMLCVTLTFIGFFPEEAPVALLLWLGAGVSWGQLTVRHDYAQFHIQDGVLAFVGSFIGLTGLLGPGIWVMTLILAGGYLLERANSPS